MLSGGEQHSGFLSHAVLFKVLGWIGPLAYLVYSVGLKTLPQHNNIIRFADDTTTLIPQYSSVSIDKEFQHVQR